MGGLLHLVWQGGTGWGSSLAKLLLAEPSLTVHPSTTIVPITVLLYNDQLLCTFNVPIKGLKSKLLIIYLC